MSDLQEPLNAAELKELDELLLSRFDDADDDAYIDCDEGIRSISELDGFLTAVVSSPETLVPSRWMPVMWGDVEPEWPDEATMQRFMELLFRHLNGIVTTLLDAPEEFEPAVFEHCTKDEQGRETRVPLIGDWCEGYVRGVGMASDAWCLTNPDVMRLLAPIVALGSAAGHEVLSELDDPDRWEKLVAAVPASARAAHAYWLAHRWRKAVPVVRTEPRVGRNDPCPCGSGRKHKKCCLQ